MTRFLHSGSKIDWYLSHFDLGTQSLMNSWNLATNASQVEQFTQTIQQKLVNVPLFTRGVSSDLPLSEQRQLAKRRLDYLLNNRVVPLDLYQHMDKYFTIMDQLHLIDSSMVIKYGVHLGLTGSAINFLGTKKHRKYLQDLLMGAHGGCFAMTEYLTGSDAYSIRTTATYDHPTRSFIINNSVEQGSHKYWIGNAGIDGTLAVVFAQLRIPVSHQIDSTPTRKFIKHVRSHQTFSGAEHGVHAFIVPIRDPQTKQVLPNITIADCGHKIGLNGVDNGSLEFDSVRIPYDHFLDRLASIDTHGHYHSVIKSKQTRFGVMLCSLSGGRVALASGSLFTTRIALTIALKYALIRRQFGQRLLDYSSHRLRLVPLLATTYVMTSVVNYLKDFYVRATKKKQLNPSVMRQIHLESSGLKAVITWYALQCIQVCRESCGGHGYSSKLKMGQMKNDLDVYTTFEGDNTVLLLSVAGMIFKEYSKKSKWQYLVDYLAHQRMKISSFFTQQSNMFLITFLERELIYYGIWELQKSKKSKKPMKQKFNQIHYLALEIAQIRAKRIALQKFKQEHQVNLFVGSTHAHLFELTALFILQNHLSWSPILSKYLPQIKQQIIDLVNQISVDEIKWIVQEFDIPEVFWNLGALQEHQQYHQSIMASQLLSKNKTPRF